MYETAIIIIRYFDFECFATDFLHGYFITTA